MEVSTDTKGLEGNKGHINTTCDQTLADTNVTPVVRFHKMTKKNACDLIKKLSKNMVFCYQNCSNLLWEKNVLVIDKNF